MGNSDHLTDGAERLGADPRNLQWADDQSRFSYKHLQTLGWSDSQGLGNTFLGNPNHIIVSRKSDNGGIGMQRARKEGDDQAAGAGQAGQGLEDVLKRLAGGSASPSPAPEGITKSERSEGRISSVRNIRSLGWGLYAGLDGNIYTASARSTIHQPHWPRYWASRSRLSLFLLKRPARPHCHRRLTDQTTHPRNHRSSRLSLPRPHPLRTTSDRRCGRNCKPDNELLMTFVRQVR